MAKQRGRPKSTKTLEQEKIDAVLQQPHAHLPIMTDQEHAELERQLAASKKIEAQIYAGHSPTIPHELILAIESLGDRSLFEEDDWVLESEQKITKKYNTLISSENDGRKRGAQATAKKSHDRAKAFWDKNPDLFEAMGRPRNANTTAQRIIDNWPTRGDGGEVPSINTIKNWYKLIQISKGSSSKN